MTHNIELVIDMHPTRHQKIRIEQWARKATDPARIDHTAEEISIVLCDALVASIQGAEIQDKVDVSQLMRKCIQHIEKGVFDTATQKVVLSAPYANHQMLNEQPAEVEDFVFNNQKIDPGKIRYIRGYVTGYLWWKKYYVVIDYDGTAIKERVEKDPTGLPYQYTMSIRQEQIQEARERSFNR